VRLAVAVRVAVMNCVCFSYEGTEEREGAVALLMGHMTVTEASTDFHL